MREYIIDGVTYAAKKEYTCRGCAFEYAGHCDNRPDCEGIIWVRQEIQDRQPKHYKQWEYKFEKMAAFIVDQDTLGSFGGEGWELCSIDYGCFILKREKQ
jgi:hypothetical protein